MNEKQAEQILQKLDSVLHLLALREITERNQRESIIFLDSAGLDRALIARITGANKNTISVRIAEAKKQKKKKP